MAASERKRLIGFAFVSLLVVAGFSGQGAFARAKHESSKHSPTACLGGTTGSDHADMLIGTDAADRIRGARGTDTVIGLAGDDCLATGVGNDRIRTGSGEDRVVAGSGRDRVDAADGESDQVQCGRGIDTIVADRTDHLSGCERVDRSPDAVGPATDPEPAPVPPPPIPASGEFPTPASTGVPPGWTPKQTRTTNLHVTQPGAVIEDVLLKNADIDVEAPNVTLRRVVLQGGVINNWPGRTCNPGLVVEQSTIEPAPGQDYGNDTEGVISYGGYTAKSVKIWHRSEGFRASNCGPVRIEDSFALVTPPRPCGDWHGDGLQGYGADAITIRNVTLELDTTGCGGTAPFFVPSGQGNTSVDVDRLLVKGGGYPFRLGVPGAVSGLKIADDSWAFGPVDVRCSVLNGWDAEIVALSPAYQITQGLGSQQCEGVGN